MPINITINTLKSLRHISRPSHAKCVLVYSHIGYHSLSTHKDSWDTILTGFDFRFVLNLNLFKKNDTISFERYSMFDGGWVIWKAWIKDRTAIWHQQALLKVSTSWKPKSESIKHDNFKFQHGRGLDEVQ